MKSKSHTLNHEKQVAVILPKWCLDMIVDHLDMQYDSLHQEQDFHHRVGDTKSISDSQDELQRIGTAIDQITGYLQNI